MDFASSLISDKFIASFNNYNRADLLKVYLYQSVMNSAYAVELSRQRSTNTSRISIGYEHRFGSEVLVKSKLIAMGPWLHYFSTSGIQERFTAIIGGLIC
uniref:Uncharacterized protein n=1 Tax=Brassica oleracea TaxID=3712 RepID=A0A3P6FWU7_BRAOL|nr:unnamed protein product [Brassica oleracea]